jgi:hypothetical protein
MFSGRGVIFLVNAVGDYFIVYLIVIELGRRPYLSAASLTDTLLTAVRRFKTFVFRNMRLDIYGERHIILYHLSENRVIDLRTAGDRPAHTLPCCSPTKTGQSTLKRKKKWKKLECR